MRVFAALTTILTLAALALIAPAPKSLSAQEAPEIEAQVAPKGREAPAAKIKVDELSAIATGVKDFDSVGTEGALNLWGDAQALVLGSDGEFDRPIVAATNAGKGKVLALGHPGYLGKPKINTGRHRLLTNFLRARLKTQKNPTVVGGAKGVETICEEMGWRFIAAGNAWDKQLDSAHVVVLAPGAAGTEAQLKKLHAFVQGGGYVAISFAGWIYTQYWAKGKDLVKDSWVNQFTMPYGISFGDAYIKSITSPKDVTKEQLQDVNADVCFARLPDLANQRRGKITSANRKRALKSYGRICASALRFSPLNPQGFAGKIASKLPKAPRVTEKKPVRFDTPMKRLAVILWQRKNALQSVDERKAAPGVETFPGVVGKNAPRSKDFTKVSLARSGWVSTGYYAPAGEVVTLTLPKSVQKLGLKIRVGANKDKLYGHRDTWYRYPDISQLYDVDGPALRVNNAFGGLIYIENPKPHKKLSFQLGVVGAVKAPRFVLGETTNEEWKANIRGLQAPWAELECKHVIITLPSKLIRNLDDPEALMTFWEKTRAYYAELTGRPLQERCERLVDDVMISNGYMHAGYPIMMQTYGRANATLVDLKKLSETPRASAWGLWHELGHNHQEKDWTFSNTTEVTVNLFSLYVCERITSKSFIMKHRGSDKRLEGYFRKKLTWKDWGKHPFEGLQMYELIIQEFGWDAIKSVFKTYRDLKVSERPKTDLEKRSQWMVRLSKQVKRNLGPYFDAFGVEVTKEAKAEIAGLDEWMPKVVNDLLKRFPRGK